MIVMGEQLAYIFIHSFSFSSISMAMTKHYFVKISGDRTHHSLQIHSFSKVRSTKWAVFTKIWIYFASDDNYTNIYLHLFTQNVLITSSQIQYQISKKNFPI